MDPRPLSDLLNGMLAEREALRRKQAEALKQARTAAGMSQNNFARLAGISQAYLSQVENGNRVISTPTLETMTQSLAAQTTGGTSGQSTSSTAQEDAAKARRQKA